MKLQENRAWLLLISALTILCLVGALPMVAAFNYSFFDLFTIREAYWVGDQWYRQIMTSDRFFASLGRSFLFSFFIMMI